MTSRPDPATAGAGVVRLTRRGRATWRRARRALRALGPAAGRSRSPPPARAPGRRARHRRPAGAGGHRRTCARSTRRPGRRARPARPLLRRAGRAGSRPASTRADGADDAEMLAAPAPSWSPRSDGPAGRVRRRPRPRADDVAEIKRMWVQRRRGAAPGSGSPAAARSWRTLAARARATGRRLDTNGDAGRGDRDVRPGGLPPDRPLQRQPLRAGVVREAAVSQPGMWPKLPFWKSS